MTLHFEPLDSAARLDDVIAQLRPEREAAVLDWQDAAQPGRGFTWIGFDPADRVTFEESDRGCPFDALEAAVRRFPETACADSGVAFSGGWIGFFAYEAALRTESIPSRAATSRPTPLLDFALYDHGLVFDHQARTWTAAVVEWSGPRLCVRPSCQARLAELKSFLREAEARSASLEGRGDALIDPQPSAVAPWRPSLTREEHRRRVQRIREYIAAGDVYQVNLTVRFETKTCLSPLELCRRLREINPAPYAALILRESYAVISASPELFLDVAGRQAITRPIKGTRPRSADARADAAARQALATSEKDAAELAMIVDLLRNDLGRVSEYGSVRVVNDGLIEAHPTVFHRVATIESRLRADVALAELLRATCPGGSITGAPKVRAMQIIHELEPCRRGVYCGSIGCIGLDGRVRLNLAIRTMEQVGSVVYVHAGGGIVADSDPDEEYAELMCKAWGMFRALGIEEACDARGGWT